LNSSTILLSKVKTVIVSTDFTLLLQNGLFDDIADGLLSAKVAVVCMSDEYANSPTCQIEFRYAANTLKLPLIICVVGTGDAWRATEVLDIYN